MHAELDYSKKDAVRHIVKGGGTLGQDTLRLRLLRNLEGVRKNKPIAQSEVGSKILSLRSRASNVSARGSVAHAGHRGVTSLNDGRLTKIDEISPNVTGKAISNFCCEACPNNSEAISEDDLVINEDVSKTMMEEENLQTAYNEFRNRKGLSMIDFKDPSNLPHNVQLCMNCLLESFQARRVEAGDYELDEVSAYRGTLMQGIGIK